jgi:hypothetical protein
MSLWVLDSDTLSLWFHGQSSVSRRVANTDPNDLAVTIVTVEEVLRGWYTQIRRAKNDAQLARSYESLQQAVQFTSEVRILPFDLSSIQRFRHSEPYTAEAEPTICELRRSYLKTAASSLPAIRPTSRESKAWIWKTGRRKRTQADGRHSLN